MNKRGFYTCYDERYFSNESLEKINKKNKKVEFSIFRDVVIVPKLSETCNTIDIWWSDVDKINASKTMRDEILGLQRIYPDITVKEALKILYQPSQ